MMEERFNLAKVRIAEIEKETQIAEPYCSYFKQVASFLMGILDCFEHLSDFDKVSDYSKLSELFKYNHELYKDILPDNYEKSYANPQYAVSAFGKEMGQFLAALYAELRSLIVSSYEDDVTSMVIRMELFLEIYFLFVVLVQHFILVLV